MWLLGGQPKGQFMCRAGGVAGGMAVAAGISEIGGGVSTGNSGTGLIVPGHGTPAPGIADEAATGVETPRQGPVGASGIVEHLRNCGARTRTSGEHTLPVAADRQW